MRYPRFDQLSMAMRVTVRRVWFTVFGVTDCVTHHTPAIREDPRLVSPQTLRRRQALEVHV